MYSKAVYLVSYLSGSYWIASTLIEWKKLSTLAEQLVFSAEMLLFGIWNSLSMKVLFMLMVRRALSNLMKNWGRRVFVND